LLEYDWSDENLAREWVQDKDKRWVNGGLTGNLLTPKSQGAFFDGSYIAIGTVHANGTCIDTAANINSIDISATIVQFIWR